MNWRTGVLSIKAVAVKDGSLLLAAGSCVYRYFEDKSEWRCVQPIPRSASVDDARFLVTNQAVFLGDSAGVFRSRDAGLSWDMVNHGLQGEVRYLSEGGGAIYAGGSHGVFRSEDEGDSWVRMNPDKTRFTTLAATGRTVFAGDDSGMSVSLDSGKSWARANEGLTGLLSVNSLAAFGPDLYAAADASIWKRPLSELDSGSLGLSGSRMAAHRSLDLRVIRTGRGPAIAFNLPARGPVRLDMFDFSGRHAGTLINGVLDQGPAEAVLAGTDVHSGGYILRLRAGGQQRTVKIALAP